MERLKIDWTTVTEGNLKVVEKKLIELGSFFIIIYKPDCDFTPFKINLSLRIVCFFLKAKSL